MRRHVLAATIASCIAVTGARAQPPATEQTAAASKQTEAHITKEVAFDNGAVRLSGVLTLPPGEVPHPAVFLISGSGPQDRDGALAAIPGYRPFAAIAEHLASRGVAVLRYDDRGVGKSTGDYGAGTEADFVRDAEAALGYLRARSDIDAKRIGVVGHSEGCIIAAMLAADNPDVAFVVSLAGPATDGYQLLLRQAERSAKVEGMSEEAVAQGVQEQRRIFDLVLAKKWDELTDVVEEITLGRLEALPQARTAAIGDLDAFARKRAAQSVRTFQHPRYQFILGHDSGKDWAKVRVPVLAVFAELDVQCDAAQNATAFRRVFSRSGNDDLTVVVIPGANHLFVKTETGSMREYAMTPKAYAPGFFDTISNWLNDKIVTEGTESRRSGVALQDQPGER